MAAFALRLSFIFAFAALLASPVPVRAQVFLNEIVDADIGRIGPTGLAIDVVGGVSYLYAVDNVNGRVLKYNLATGARLSFFGTVGNAQGQLNSPYGVAVDPVSHDIYVAERGNHRISRFTADGTFVLSWGSTFGNAPGQFDGPIGVAADASGNVYVTDHNNNRVQKFRVQGGTVTHLLSFGGAGAAAGQFNAPYGITLDASGTLWVADAGNHRVQRFDSNGGFLGSVGGLNTPTWVSFDATGNYYIAETNATPQNGSAADIQNQRILKYSAAGALLASWGSVGEAGGQFKLPFMIVVDAAGNGYVSDYYNTRIQKFNLNAAPAPGVPQINSSASAAGTVNAPFLYNTFSLGFPPANAYAAAGLPPGLTINAASGAITGTPASSGTFNVALGATNSVGTGNATLALTIAGAAGSPVISSPATASATVGSAFSYSISASGSPTSFSASGLAPGLTVNAATGVVSGTPTASGTYVMTVTATNAFGSNSANVTVTVGANTTGPSTLNGSGLVAAGGTATFNVSPGAGTTVQWQHNGTSLPGANAAALVVGNVQNSNAGIYTAVMTNGTTTTTQSFILGLYVPPSAKTVGAATEVGSNILHPQTGNTYDQVLLEGSSATFRADAGQITRMSYIDLNDDIVQIEFSGAGTVSVVLDNVTGPATPTKYNQPTVSYMRGHANIVVAGADASTNISVFSVGKDNAVNQALFIPGVGYDGRADIAVLGVHSATGAFTSLRAANTTFFAAKGMTGVYAPGVTFSSVVYIGEIMASDSATPAILLGSAADVSIRGGDLLQLNSRAVQVSGFTRLPFMAGATSHGDPLPAQTCLGRLEQNGADVTSQIVVNPN